MKWFLGISLILSIALGIGIYTFVYAKGISYLSDNPQVCVNCHVMRGEFDGWVKSTHHAVATCNDCHTPKNKIGKWITKARNGFWHSFHFTAGSFHEPIQIKKHNFKIAEDNCHRCHQNIVMALEGVTCTHCHKEVGH